MSEVLRDLIVSLSLDSDNFTRNMRTINLQIKEAESRFALAGAGVDKYEKTIDGARAKLTTLGETHTHQTRAVDQYSRALVEAHRKLEASHAMHEKMTARLGAAQGEYAQLGTQLNAYGMTATEVSARLADVNDKIQEYSAMSNKPLGTLSALDAERRRLEQIQQAQTRYKELGDEIKKLEGQIKANEKTMQNNADSVAKWSTKLNEAKAALKTTEAEISRLSKELVTMESRWTTAGTALEKFSKHAKSVSDATLKAGKTLTKFVTTPILGLGAAAIKSSLDFESAFTSVRKTVDASEQEFEQLSDSIKEMSTVAAASAEDIAETMAVAGQMGIDNKYLVDFTRTMIDLGNSTDISTTEGAAELAQFANVAKMSHSQFENFGSAIVELGNNFPTTEDAILKMSTRLAAAGTQVGLSESQIVGFATALSSVGVRAEMGGSTFSKALVKMQVAVETGGEALADFSKVAGLTEQQFAELWKSDPSEAFQAFILGLSQMNDEGASAIKTLEEIDISEVRLRDTLLRATNATELFQRAQTMSAKAWKENTALAEEANKRYGTTASQLTNLKNTATLFARQLGDDLNPTIRAIADGARDMLERFQGLDEQQRMMLIKLGGIAAGIGPAIFAFSKLSKGISSVTGTIGKFATAVGKAGGGWAGFMKVIGSSPLTWIALTVAVVAGTAALIDYASGAKAARDAMQGMMDVADEWANRNPDTVYSKGGLAEIGLAPEDFADAEKALTAAEQWRDGLIKVWTDGKGETDEIVNEWTESFRSLNTGMITTLETMKAEAEANGDIGLAERLQADIDALQDMNAEIEALLKKRQNGYLTADEKLRLDELIDTREGIQIKYSLVPDSVGGGYQQILDYIEVEKARAHARGQKTVSEETYDVALTASAQGYGAVIDAIDERYAAEYKVVQQIEDTTERLEAQKKLDEEYRAERKAAAIEYAAVMAEIMPNVWDREGIQNASADMDELMQLFRLYSTTDDKNSVLEQMEAFAKNMNQDDLLSYIGMLQQAQELLHAGMSEEEVQAVFPGLDMTHNLDQLAALAQFAADHNNSLEGLSKILNEIVPEQMQEIAVTLNMDGAKEAWIEFADHPGAITTDAVVDKYDVTAEVPQPVIDVLVESFSEVEGGADTFALTPRGVVAEVNKYLEAEGYNADDLTPDQIEAIVNAYSEATGVDKSELLQEFIAYIKEYQESGTPSAPQPLVDALIEGYKEIDGGANTDLLTPEGVVAEVNKYLEAEGYNADDLTPDQIKAIVDAYSEATGVDKSELLQAFVAYIQRYDDSRAVPPRLAVQAYVVGYDRDQLNKFRTNNPIEINGIFKLGELFDSPEDLFDSENVRFFQDGIEIPVDVVPREKIGPDTLLVLSEDGTMNVLFRPEIVGLQEAIDDARAGLESGNIKGDTSGWLATLLGEDSFGWMRYLTGEVEGAVKDKGTWKTLWGLLDSSNFGTLNTIVAENFSGDAGVALQMYVQDLVTAIQSGEEVSEEDMQHLQEIIDFVAALETAGIGQDLVAGIGYAMEEAGWSGSAETVAGNLEKALNAAFGIQSPAQLTMPVGEFAAAGIGKGLAEYSLEEAAKTAAEGLVGALRTTITENTTKPVGRNASLGLAQGILTGKAQVVAAIRDVARSAVSAAKLELKIASPSQVFEDEVGREMARGLGVGALEESKQQAKVMRNAMRYLTDETRAGLAIGGAIPASANNNYNYTSSAAVHVDKLYVNDKQDVSALAVEIASITQRRQRGKGKRKA